MVGINAQCNQPRSGSNFRAQCPSALYIWMDVCSNIRLYKSWIEAMPILHVNMQIEWIRDRCLYDDNYGVVIVLTIKKTVMSTRQNHCKRR